MQHQIATGREQTKFHGTIPYKSFVITGFYQNVSQFLLNNYIEQVLKYIVVKTFY